MARVLIIGGYGNFGSFIARRLAQEADITVIIAGRSEEKAKALAENLKAEWTALDIEKNLDESLKNIKPDIVIHTSGPFQERGYDVAEACIRNKCHYIDLADGREFVANITRLDSAAKEAGILVVSGASSVPCLTAAIIDKYKSEFQHLESIDYGIATAQRTNAGLATTAAILGYAGKPFTTKIDGKIQIVYGWQSLTAHQYPELGWRLLGNCDIPDLGVFPSRYPDLKTIRFRAGLEVPLLHMGLWAMSWFVRIGLIKSLRSLASALYKIAPLFDAFGSNRSAFHMEMKGQDANGKQKVLTFYILTGSGHGPNIPCIPSILLAQRLACGEIVKTGAAPCMDMIDLESYLKALKDLDIKWEIQ
ncbi:MAG: saccharopine dehydrogenase NADP-binding domain-containing protein [Micavibrio aeruginosavorus]|uniref:Saccharopine dehydrogenase NADP-binding domain-containing protein n=1 Tax=Micavibrio aeruginosavorus TaxID=349221 RepID=A0A7T5R0X7_9BACT|nr:MAG: saccharopine dehydrogenase NADP-binding domain-containing protein [Micavibrio aeruginosavorus]